MSMPVHNSFKMLELPVLPLPRPSTQEFGCASTALLLFLGGICVSGLSLLQVTFVCMAHA